MLLLPKEGHAYKSRESIMTVLAEQHDWLIKHVKNRKPKAVEAKSVVWKEEAEIDSSPPVAEKLRSKL